MMSRLSSEDIGKAVQKARKNQKLRQEDLAFACGTGVRFIVDLEKGKPTCQLGKALEVLAMLGISLKLQLPEDPYGQ